LYPVTTDPPSEAGADHDNPTDPLPAEATNPTGAEGTVACGVADTSLELAETPTAFTAATV
jgi:hypothetical protein